MERRESIVSSRRGSQSGLTSDSKSFHEETKVQDQFHSVSRVHLNVFKFIEIFFYYVINMINKNDNNKITDQIKKFEDASLMRSNSARL